MSVSGKLLINSGFYSTPQSTRRSAITPARDARQRRRSRKLAREQVIGVCAAMLALDRAIFESHDPI